MLVEMMPAFPRVWRRIHSLPVVLRVVRDDEPVVGMECKAVHDGVRADYEDLCE